MATKGKSWSKARAECPRPEHARSRVRFDGHYGRPEHRRQLYRCVPANGDRPHRFTEVLPREEAWHDACEACERPVHLHEGPHAARRYQFVARGIAEALQAVGAGATYRQAPTSDPHPAWPVETPSSSVVRGAAVTTSGVSWVSSLPQLS